MDFVLYRRCKLEKISDNVVLSENVSRQHKKGVCEMTLMCDKRVSARIKGETLVRCAVGVTEEFKVEVGRHQDGP